MGDVIVDIEQGRIRGKKVKDDYAGIYYSFLGIPYAKPPLGKLRFKSPQPPDKWNGIRDATQEGSGCFARDMFLKNYVGSEDCLFLNVFTPELPSAQRCKQQKKAVMVFIHGGAFTAGSSTTMIYGPEFLIAEDIVLVTINYRLGILGFLRLHDASLDVPGNAGLKDMVMALKWVQTNIERFGGDPKNVTIFGESAGGSAVHFLLLSPMAKGLFHKGIMQSGCALNPWAMASGDITRIVNALGLQTRDEKIILEHLQRIPVQELLEAQNKSLDHMNVSKIRPVAPVVETITSRDPVLPDYPENIIRSGNYTKVPLIIGYNDREGLLTAVSAKEKLRPMTDFENAIPHMLKLQRGSDISKAVAKRIKEFYYKDETPSINNMDNFFKLATDNFFSVGLHRTIKGHLATSDTPIYVYRMDLVTELNIFKKVSNLTYPGVCHGDDLGYLFKTMLTPEIKKNSQEEKYIKYFTKLWTNFAKYGNPSTENIKWLPAKKDRINYLKISKEFSMDVGPDAENMKFWDEIYGINNTCKL